jgi:dipeptidyl aminopeptidase/acylaminoacyl peptidase
VLGAILLTEARGEDANDVYLFDVASGRLDTLFAPEDRADHGGFQWTPEGDAFYLATNREGEYRVLSRYEATSGELEVVAEEEGRDVESVALSGDGRYLAWTVNDGGLSRLRVRDRTTASLLSAPDLPAGIYSLEWAPEAPVLAIQVAGPTVPGDIWTWDLGAGTVARATRSDAAGLDLDRMVTPTHHSFPSLDGLTIHGLLYHPPEGAWRGEGPPPVLLAVHGGPTAQARPRFDAPHQYLLTRGVAILDLNFRGSTGYGKTFARLNDRRLREDELLDLEAAVRWLEEREDVDGSRVAIMGGSYGGYLTMAGLTRLPDLFRSGVALVGVSDWITALEGASPQLQASDRIEYGDIHDPDDREFFRQISPITHIENIRAPSMVLHGANDPRDPVEESDRFVAAIRELGGEVQYLRFPDEGHSIRRLENRIIAYRRIAGFLEETLEVR